MAEVRLDVCIGGGAKRPLEYQRGAARLRSHQSRESCSGFTAAGHLNQSHQETRQSA